MALGRSQVVNMSPIPIFPNINSIPSCFKGILLDAYGVFWGGNLIGLLPGAKEAMESLVLQGKIVGILSNTTQLAEKEILKLQRHGLRQGIHFHFLITSGEIARSLFLEEKLPFATPKKKYCLFGEIHPRFASHYPIFQETSYQETLHLHEADFIYISIPHLNGEDQINPFVFHENLLQLKGTGLPMVCPNPDRFAHEGNPARAVVRQGSIATIYEALGGSVFYIGKPQPMAYAAAMKGFVLYQITQASDVLMIGDNPETDIRGARQFGMPAAIITQTGLMADRISQQGWEKAFGELCPQEIPNFCLERLANK